MVSFIFRLMAQDPSFEENNSDDDDAYLNAPHRAAAQITISLEKHRGLHDKINQLNTELNACKRKIEAALHSVEDE